MYLLLGLCVAIGILFLTIGVVLFVKNNKKLQGSVFIAAAIIFFLAAILAYGSDTTNSDYPTATEAPKETSATETTEATSAPTESADATAGNTTENSETDATEATATAAVTATATATTAPMATVKPTSVPTSNDGTAVKPDNWNNSTIYLTFDDGPSTTVTPIVLDTLKKYNIKATFFILDYDDSKKPIIQRMIDEGHTVGIHGYSHEYSEIYASDEACMNNITKLADKLYSDFGYTATVIRFPGGSSNTTSKKYCSGIMTRMVKKVVEAGYQYVDWNVSPEDAMSKMTKEAIFEAVKKDLSSTKESNVVLMHDYGGQNTSGEAVELIVEYGLANGYAFDRCTVSKPVCHHGVNN